MSVDPRIAPNVDALRYHGDVAARDATLDFAVNVRGTMPEWLRQTILKAVDQLTPYPDSALDLKVREALGRLHERPADEVLLLAGVAEGFSLLSDLERAPTIIYPQFTEPEAAFAAAGKPVRRFLVPEPFVLDDAVVGQLRDSAHEMIIVGNPTNPTGVLHSRERIVELTELADLVVVDEAFMDVTGHCDQVTVAGVRNPKLLVFRSMTKTWSIAGLRCGYALGATEVLAKLARRRPHWPVGTLQLSAMLAIAEHSATELPGIRAEVAKARGDMASLLESAGWRVLPSEGPFLLVQPLGTDQADSAETEKIRLTIAECGIAVRRCDTFPGLDSSYWRLAVRGRADVGTLVDSVRQITCCEDPRRSPPRSS